MKFNITIYVIGCLSLILFKCNNYPEGIEEVLKLAGNNRIQIEQAIEHYKDEKDSLKLKALYFIIKQLSYYGTLHYRFLNSEKEEIELGNWDYKNPPEALAYLKKNKLIFHKDSISADIKRITKDYLVKNIDLTFYAWQNYPWTKELSFKELCENILPYKINGEPLNDWRSFYFEKHKLELDSLTKVNASSETVCFWLNDRYKKKWIKSASVIPVPYLSYEKIEYLGGGTCDHLAKNAIQLMRACGIPLNLDVVPLHGRINGGHTYNSLYQRDAKKFIFFSPYERDPERRDWRAPRIFRQSFALHEQPILDIVERKDLPPGLLGSPYYYDVTEQYFPTMDVEVKVKVKSKGKIAYLCTYSDGEFKSTNIWGIVEKNKATFKNVTKELLYFPMFYFNKVFINASDPFILRDNGSIITLDNKPSKRINIEQVKLRAVNNNITKSGEVYRLLQWNGNWELLKEQEADNDQTLYFENILENGLYLLYGSERLERIQRPFTCLNGQVEYW